MIFARGARANNGPYWHELLVPIAAVIGTRNRRDRRRRERRPTRGTGETGDLQDEPTRDGMGAFHEVCTHPGGRF